MALFVYGAQRGSPAFEAVLNAWDLGDLDRDDVGSGVDCNDENAGLKAPPGEVAGVRIDRIAGATRVSFTSQDATAGTDTVYDVASGFLSELRADAGFAQAFCLAGAAPDSPYDDGRVDPAPGSGWYYLLRARNGCGAGTYGASRSGLDASSPCP
jgi:hypothetical protein